MSKKLTQPQTDLYIKLKQVASGMQLSFEGFKKIANFKSFDASFNVLLKQGYVKRIGVENQFELIE